MPLSCRGFRCGALHAGIKESEKPDLAIIASDAPAVGAAVFTRNRVVAAPVTVSRRALMRNGGKVRAVVVNSGNANACTGQRGMADAERMIALTAESLDVPADEVMVASTGVIGVPLPMDRIEPAVGRLAGQLQVSGFEQFADGILTTDRGRKLARKRVELDGKKVTLVGCTKGAGMIAPNMATTLAFVLTDARVGAKTLTEALQRATDATFNRMVIDGDTSTNDMILVMASGAAGNRSARGGEASRFEDTLTALLDDLAHALMRDGEGVNHVVTVHVSGARSDKGARTMADAIARSPLVKTALAGRDPNWGRILAAAGYSGAAMSAARARMWIAGVQVVEGGIAIADPRAEPRAARAMKAPEYEIVLDLGQGSGEAKVLGCDLSHQYVTINADYRT